MTGANDWSAADLPVVLLCGGQGTRLREETGVRPKPLIEIGGRPILWHIMKGYAAAGCREFVLCLGYKGELIKDYFWHYQLRNSDVTLDLGSGEIAWHNQHLATEWQVTMADTGELAMTGARLARVRHYLGDRPFFLTYGDGVADVDLDGLLRHHRSHRRLVTITGVHPPSRFGELRAGTDEIVRDFIEKPQLEREVVNGGFFVMEPGVFDYVFDEDHCVLEREPLERLAADDQLVVYGHDGFWHCMDTYRDLTLLEELWSDGKAPWRTW
jgi:glucose-1-phosphate cytidylyltransferase